MKKTFFEIPIFEYRIEVVLCKDFQKYLDKEGLNSTEKVTANQACLFSEFDRGRSYMLFSADHEITRQIVSHESNHAAFELLHYKGIPINYDNQEIICYLQDYIFEKVMSWIDSQKLTADS